MTSRTPKGRMRHVATAAALLFAAGTANAGMLLELELYTGSTPSGITTALPGSNIDVAVWMSPGPAGVSYLQYDLVSTAGVSVIGVSPSLVIPGSHPNCPAPSSDNCNMGPLGPAGGIGTNSITFLNEATVGIGPTGGKWLVAITRWNFSGLDQIDVNVVDTLDNALPAQPISPVNTTSFTIVPEPATASLLALALGGLALAGRRRRH